MITEAIKGLLLPFFGTSLGAAGVWCVRRNASETLSLLLNDAAAGVMVAASVFSLLLPALAEAERNGSPAVLTVSCGFLAGMLLLALWDRVTLRIETAGGVNHATRMLVLSVCLHNVPEGMAVGAAYAALLSGNTTVTAAGAFALALGIALQNLPEGAIISMPLHAQGMGKRLAFFCGVLSGASEPVAGALTILLARFAVPVLPLLLSFAAGAMAYVVGFELLPQTLRRGRRLKGLLCMAGGFFLMTLLDILLG
jgi:ZIP family zinc transporter